MRICLPLLLRLLLVAAAASPAPAQTDLPDWAFGPFTRPVNEPVIKPRPESIFHDPLRTEPVHWEALHTFNPAAVVRNGKVMVLYRAEDDSGSMQIGMHTSRLGLAESEDGIHFTRLPEPVFYPAEDSQKSREWPGGVEDPRIVEAPDGTYVLTYTQWNRKTYTIGVATSPDLIHWTKHGPALGETGPYANLMYKSGGIVTRLDEGRLIAARIHGKFWMYWGEIQVRVASFAGPDSLDSGGRQPRQANRGAGASPGPLRQRIPRSRHPAGSHQAGDCRPLQRQERGGGERSGSPPGVRSLFRG